MSKLKNSSLACLNLYLSLIHSAESKVSQISCVMQTDFYRCDLRACLECSKNIYLKREIWLYAWCVTSHLWPVKVWEQYALKKRLLCWVFFPVYTQATEQSAIIHDTLGPKNQSRNPWELQRFLKGCRKECCVRLCLTANSSTSIQSTSTLGAFRKSVKFRIWESFFEPMLFAWHKAVISHFWP